MLKRSSAAVATSREGHRSPSFHPVLERVAYGTPTTRRGALVASCIAALCIRQRDPAPHASGQIRLRHKASIAARGASDRNLYQGVLQTTALHVAHDMSYRL